MDGQLLTYQGFAHLATSSAKKLAENPKTKSA
jgi:hypothetical protein